MVLPHHRNVCSAGVTWFTAVTKCSTVYGIDTIQHHTECENTGADKLAQGAGKMQQKQLH